MSEKQDPFTKTLYPYDRAQWTDSSTSIVPIPSMPTPLPSVLRIRFPGDCDLAHYCQTFPRSSTAPPSPLSAMPTSPLSSPSPPPSESPSEHIPRPPNAFMLFRSDFLKRDVIPPSVERRQQTLSRVAGEVWNLMPAEEKKKWHEKSAEALRLHNEKHPNYKFSPARKGSGRKNKGEAAEEDDLGNKVRIREIRERYLHIRGPAVAPSRRRKGNLKQQASASEDEKPGICLETSCDRLAPPELCLSEPRETVL